MFLTFLNAFGRDACQRAIGLKEGNEEIKWKGGSKKCKNTKEIRESKRVRDLELRRNVPLPPLLYLCLELCSENY